MDLGVERRGSGFYASQRSPRVPRCAHRRRRNTRLSRLMAQRRPAAARMAAAGLWATAGSVGAHSRWQISGTHRLDLQGEAHSVKIDLSTANAEMSPMIARWHLRHYQISFVVIWCTHNPH